MVSFVILFILFFQAAGTRPLPPAGALRRDGHERNRYAYVMLAFDPPGASPRSLWGVLPMAHALQEVSSYPLVVLTNTSHFPDGTPVKESLAKLNVQVLPVDSVPVPDAVLREYRNQPCAEVDPPVCSYQYLKLQIWQLAQFDKLIWMDSDAILTKSIDGLFLQNGTWAQQDNWDCGSWASFFVRQTSLFTQVVDWLQRTVELQSFQKQDEHQHQSDNPCSGLLLLEPSKNVYQGLLQYIGKLTSAPGGDQQVITDYFAKVAHAPLKVVDVSVASFGQCIEKVPGGEMPAFVHKSDWTNRCFYLGALAQECRFHPLGEYWHSHFCQAATTMGLKGKTVIDFCDSWDALSAVQTQGYGLRPGDYLAFLFIIGFIAAIMTLGYFAVRMSGPRASSKGSLQKRGGSGPLVIS